MFKRNFGSPSIDDLSYEEARLLYEGIDYAASSSSSAPSSTVTSSTNEIADKITTDHLINEQEFDRPPTVLERLAFLSLSHTTHDHADVDVDDDKNETDIINRIWTDKITRTKKNANYDLFLRPSSSSVLIPVHRIILASRSPVFNTILAQMRARAHDDDDDDNDDDDNKGDVKNNKHEASSTSVIDVEGEAGAVKECMNAIYTEAVRLTPDNISKVVEFATLYRLDTVRLLCLSFIEKSITLDNVCSFLIYAPESSIVANRCLDFIRLNFKEVSESLPFLDLPLHLLSLVLSTGASSSAPSSRYHASSSSSLAEILVFNAAIRWAEDQYRRRKEYRKDEQEEEEKQQEEEEKEDEETRGEKLRAILGDAIQYIHFIDLTPAQIAEKVVPSDFLSSSELVSLFLLKEGIPVSETDFTLNRTKRHPTSAQSFTPPPYVLSAQLQALLPQPTLAQTSTSTSTTTTTTTTAPATTKSTTSTATSTSTSTTLKLSSPLVPVLAVTSSSSSSSSSSSTSTTTTTTTAALTATTAALTATTTAAATTTATTAATTPIVITPVSVSGFGSSSSASLVAPVSLASSSSSSSSSTPPFSFSSSSSTPLSMSDSGRKIVKVVRKTVKK